MATNVSCGVKSAEQKFDLTDFVKIIKKILSNFLSRVPKHIKLFFTVKECSRNIFPLKKKCCFDGLVFFFFYVYGILQKDFKISKILSIKQNICAKTHWLYTMVEAKFTIVIKILYFTNGLPFWIIKNKNRFFFEKFFIFGYILIVS